MSLLRAHIWNPIRSLVLAAGQSALDTISDATAAVVYLLNGGFETDGNADGLADSWLAEWTTATKPTYTLVASPRSGTAQRLQYTGEGTNTGTQKVEFYQATNAGSFAPGDPATYDVYLKGAIANGYASIVMEAHQGGTYLSEVNQVVPLTANMQHFRVVYPSLPANTDTVVVVVQSPELSASTTVDITADDATVVKQALPALVRRTNYIDHPSFELGTTLASGWTESNSIVGSVTYSLSTSGVAYGAKKQNMQFTAATQTNKVVQLISNTSANGTFAPGDTASFSIAIDGTKTGCNVLLRIQFMTSAGGSAGTVDSSALAITGTPTRFSLQGVAPATTAAARVLIRITSVDTGDTFNLNLDGALLENSPTVDSYFDGDTSGFQWLGTANASLSQTLITA